MGGTVTVRQFGNKQEFVQAAVGIIKSVFEKEVMRKGYFTLVLSGGKTPLPVYEQLARENLPWERCFIFWGDERNVKSDHPGSNYGSAREKLLSRINIPSQNIFPIPVGTATAIVVAEQYEKEIRNFFKKQGVLSSTYSVFDLILLGVGLDGHTASLFAGSPAWDEQNSWVMPTTAPVDYDVRERVTMTLPLINAAKNIIFLVSGEEKSDIVNSILENQLNCPAAKVSTDGRLEWLIYF